MRSAPREKSIEQKNYTKRGGGVASTVAGVDNRIIPFMSCSASRDQGLGHHPFPERTSRWIAAPPNLLFGASTRTVNHCTQLEQRHRVVGFGAIAGLKGTRAELEAIHSPEELRMLVEQSRQRGKLDADDARLLQGV